MDYKFVATYKNAIFIKAVCKINLISKKNFLLKTKQEANTWKYLELLFEKYINPYQSAQSKGNF